jgi:hypothetical protein
MQNVAPSRALVRRSRQLLLFAFLTAAAGAFIAVIGIALFILPLAPLANQTFPVIRNVVFIAGVLVGLAGLIMAVRAMTWRTENDLALITGRWLEQHLDQRYTFIRNISKLGIGYIDAVLVRRRASWCSALWTTRASSSTKPRNGFDATRTTTGLLAGQPHQEVVVDIQRLRDSFQKRGLDNIPVYG